MPQIEGCSCRNCLYWKRGMPGECHQLAPTWQVAFAPGPGGQPQVMKMGGWPSCGPADYCGEHVPISDELTGQDTIPDPDVYDEETNGAHGETDS